MLQIIKGYLPKGYSASLDFIVDVESLFNNYITRDMMPYATEEDKLLCERSDTIEETFEQRTTLHFYNNILTRDDVAHLMIDRVTKSLGYDLNHLRCFKLKIRLDGVKVFNDKFTKKEIEKLFKRDMHLFVAV